MQARKNSHGVQRGIDETSPTREKKGRTASIVTWVRDCKRLLTGERVKVAAKVGAFQIQGKEA